MRRVSFFAILAAACCFAAVQDVRADLVVTNSSADLESTSGAARWRSFGNTGGNELYLGQGDLGVAANRVEQGFNWSSGTTLVTLAYDSTTMELSATVGGQQALSFNISDPGNMSLMQIAVADREANGIVEFNNVTLNGEAVGSFGGNGGWDVWTVSNFDFSQDWSLQGDIELTGSFSNSQEKSKVDITFGAAAIPEPASIGVLLVGCAGFLMRRRTR